MSALSPRTPAPPRRRSAGALAPLWLALVASACTGEIVNPSGDDPAVAAAMAKFTTDVQPILGGFCGGCHVGTANVDFMRPDPDTRGRMLGWPNLVNLDNPTGSSLLTKGPHSGPAFTPDQASVMLDWIELEVIAAGGEPAETVETDRVTPQPGLNSIDLGAIGLAGTTLTFLYEPLATGMYLSDIKVTAGTGGVRLVNPLFVIWNGGAPEPDPINRFGNIDLTVQEAQTSFIGGGTAVFVDVAPGSDVSVYFRSATLADGTGGGGDPGGGGTVGGGCNNVASFTANARSPLSTSCGGCHGAGGMADAYAATDLRAIDDLSADGQAAACAQTKTRINLLDPNNSGLFLAPDPNSGTGHPFKFPSTTAFTTFRSSVLLWVTAETEMP
jgi:mono/diheme cytochrome c family protein